MLFKNVLEKFTLAAFFKLESFSRKYTGKFIFKSFSANILGFQSFFQKVLLKINIERFLRGFKHFRLLEKLN